MKMEWIIVIVALGVVIGAIFAFMQFVIAPIFAKEKYNMWRLLMSPICFLLALVVIGSLFFNSDLEPFWNRLFGGEYWQDIARMIIAISPAVF
jgi:hypothetical protein